MISISPWQFGAASTNGPILTVIGVWTKPIVEWLVGGVSFKEIIWISKKIPVSTNR
ncbi:hypothetical protein N9769_04810 [Ascidiaceihabitans sp.]|nr:hypothetical protein [Ascidiaceihabitans sp.]